MKCTNCGTDLEDITPYCPACGQSTVELDASARLWSAGEILAGLIVGLFGALLEGMFFLPWLQDARKMSPTHNPWILLMQVVTALIATPVLIRIFYRLRSGKAVRPNYFVISLLITWLGAFTICATTFYGH